MGSGCFSDCFCSHYVLVIVAEEEEKDKEKRLNALMEKLKMKAGQLRSSAESAKILRMAITVGTCRWQLVFISLSGQQSSIHENNRVL